MAKKMFIFIISCIILGISPTYIQRDAIKYAKKFCKNHNPNYNSYSDETNENINFMSQSLSYGGESFSGCQGRDRFGMFVNYMDIIKCLQKKGWNYSNKMNEKFKIGNPAFLYNGRWGVITTGENGDKIIYCSHKFIEKTDKCDAEIDKKDLVFYYKE